MFEQIADLAIEFFKVGARSLRGIFEEMVTPVLYLIARQSGGEEGRDPSLFEDAKFFGAPAAAIASE